MLENVGEAREMFQTTEYVQYSMYGQTTKGGVFGIHWDTEIENALR
jgi:hypothetical protein